MHSSILMTIFMTSLVGYVSTFPLGTKGQRAQGFGMPAYSADQMTAPRIAFGGPPSRQVYYGYYAPQAFRQIPRSTKTRDSTTVQYLTNSASIRSVERPADEGISQDPISTLTSVSITEAPLLTLASVSTTEAPLPTLASVSTTEAPLSTLASVSTTEAPSPTLAVVPTTEARLSSQVSTETSVTTITPSEIPSSTLALTEASVIIKAPSETAPPLSSPSALTANNTGDKGNISRFDFNENMEPI